MARRGGARFGSDRSREPSAVAAKTVSRPHGTKKFAKRPQQSIISLLVGAATWFAILVISKASQPAAILAAAAVASMVALQWRLANDTRRNHAVPQLVVLAVLLLGLPATLALWLAPFIPDETGIPALVVGTWTSFLIAAWAYAKQRLTATRLSAMKSEAVVGLAALLALGGVFAFVDDARQPRTAIIDVYKDCSNGRFPVDDGLALTARFDGRAEQTRQVHDGTIEFRSPVYWQEMTFALAIPKATTKVPAQSTLLTEPWRSYLEIVGRVATLGQIRDDRDPLGDLVFSESCEQ